MAPRPLRQTRRRPRRFALGLLLTGETVLFENEPLLDDAPIFGDALLVDDACLREGVLEIYGVEVAEEA